MARRAVGKSGRSRGTHGPEIAGSNPARAATPAKVWGHEDFDAITPGPSTLRSGICRGGPFSGLPMHHGEPRRYIFKIVPENGSKPYLLCRAMPPDGPSALPSDTQVGVYEYDGDMWQWSREIEWPKPKE